MANHGNVIVISSHVARGSVGNRAMVFALERLGFTVWAVPSVILPHHPGHGTGVRIVPPRNDFAALLEILVQDGRAASVDGIISGYLASPEQVHAVSHVVETVKQASPEARYLCDPVIGDGERLYVTEALAASLRDELLPLADAATPNAFECAWLSGAANAAESDLEAMARGLPAKIVLVTSAPALMRGHIANMLVQEDATTLIEHPALPAAVKGTGDLLAGLLLARRLQGHDWIPAAEMAVASVFEIVAGTAKAGADELLLAQEQDSMVQPRASISVRRMAAARPRMP